MTDSCDSAVEICDNKRQVLEKKSLFLMSLVLAELSTKRGWRQEFFCGPYRSLTKDDDDYNNNDNHNKNNILVAELKGSTQLMPVVLSPILRTNFSIFLLGQPSGCFRRCFSITISKNISSLPNLTTFLGLHAQISQF